MTGTTSVAPAITTTILSNGTVGTACSQTRERGRTPSNHPAHPRAQAQSVRTAYKSKGKITEHEWRKHFIKVAVEHRRDVVPLYFEARNSELFYRIENFRKRIHSKINFEVLLFAREFFRQRGRTFTLHIGKPIPW
ncbi:MAG: hypothetical protein LBS79_09780, partial [Tannerella sp.]|nr:hypothetical protein [Tannerella sp.]